MEQQHLRSTYFYELPKERIALYPAGKREGSRMLVYNRATKNTAHSYFYDIVKYIRPGDVIVVNNTKVLRARMFGKKEETGGKAEILLVKEESRNRWEILVKTGGRLADGMTIEFAPGITGKIDLKRGKSFPLVMEFSGTADIREMLPKLGLMPLPPYIKRQPDPEDAGRYQTVYAKVPGSVAAPTAGFHFSEEIIGKLTAAGAELTEVTLHIGTGTFKPVKEEDIRKHPMHEEEYEVTAQTFEKLKNAKKAGRRIIAVGTTSARVLETVFSKEGAPLTGSTSLFIYPGFSFNFIDALITNFHLPESTLFMLICAFCGTEKTKEIYKEAISGNYRFYSYGDVMFLE